MSRPTLAAALIVRNEENNLAECLATLDWVDEIVVLDSGSTDQTQAIAERAGARFFIDVDWQGYGRQRQRAQALVRAEWIVWIDADERVSPALRASIEALLQNDPPTDTVYTLARLSWAFGRFIRHCGWYPDRVRRLYPRALTGYDEALVHEKVIVEKHMKTADLSGDLLHYTYRDLQHYLEKSAAYASAWAEQRARRGKSATLAQGVGHALSCFLKMYLFKAGFLDGRQGLLLSLLSAHSTFAKYADLWIRTRTQPPR